MVVIVVLEIRLTSLSLLKKNNLQSLKTEGFLIKNPHNYSRTSQVTSRYQEESQKGTPPKHVPMELQPEIISSLEQTEHFQLHDANSTFESQQDRLHRNPKTYKCEECQRIFKYPCRLSAHLTRKYTRRKGHFSVPGVIKASLLSQTWEYMRSYIGKVSLSNVVHVGGLSAVKPNCRLMRGFTQDRSPAQALCVTVASASHPHTTVNGAVATGQTELCTLQSYSLSISCAYKEACHFQTASSH